MNNWISSRAVLRAEHFDLKYKGPEPGELEFLLRRIEDGGEPVLELGCGTGRVLVPLLERGVDATGVDVSPAMLDRCRAKCVARRLPVELRIQSMQALELPRKFGTVFLGSCGLGVLDSEADVRATFRSVFNHLNPGGVFSFEIETPPEAAPARDRTGLWSGGWDVAEDGSALVVRMVHNYDPDTQVRASVMILERYVDGRLEDTELHETTMRFWEVETVTAYLGDVGFDDVIASNVFTDDQPPGDNHWLVIRARKPQSNTQRGQQARAGEAQTT